VHPDVLVRTSAPVVWDELPMRVQTVPFQRLLPHVKNADTLGLTMHLRRAVAAGFDDAIFLTPDGQLSEGTIWNVAFADAEGVVWPDAPALPGITQALVRQGLDRLGVPWRTKRIGLSDLHGFTGAAFMNSWTPGQPIDTVDDVRFADSAGLTGTMHAAYSRVSPQRV